MITITCCNKSCPKGKFDWNVSIDCMPAELEDPKAVWKKAFCPHCNQLNWIFVKCKRKRHISKKGRGISDITIRGRSIRRISKGGRRRSIICTKGRSIRRISKGGRRRRQLIRVPQQSEDPEDHGPPVVPVAMTTKGYDRIHLKHER